MSISFIIKRKNINVIFAKGFLLYRSQLTSDVKIVHGNIRKTTNLEENLACHYNSIVQSTLIIHCTTFLNLSQCVV